MSALDTGWDRLRHGGLLLDAARLAQVSAHQPPALPFYHEHDLRRLSSAVADRQGEVTPLVTFVLEKLCGFSTGLGTWERGPAVGAEWGRRAVTGEVVKPRHLWRGGFGATLPVFFDAEPRVGVGRSLRTVSQVRQWLRAGDERLALLTNGRQWRLIYAGLDADAWCEWDAELWFEEGGLSPQVAMLRLLLQPALWTPPRKGQAPPLLQAVLDSRKGQAEVSAALGERVREAVEIVVQAHGDILKQRCADVAPALIYRAAVRIVMRLVVVLFAESRELLPRDNALYHGAYGLSGLLTDLERIGARAGSRLARSWNAWPRVLALFRLVYEGTHHPAVPVPAYGGDLFAPGAREAADGMARALAVFEDACFDQALMSDRDVHRVLEKLTRTRVRIRQGRSTIPVSAPVDFSDLSSEYIGILYEGLLDFELKTAPAGDPIVFLGVGNQPALPLSRLDAMDDKALKALLEKMKDTSRDAGDDDEGEEGEEAEATEGDEAEGAAVVEGEVDLEAAEEAGQPDEPEDAPADDERHVTRTRAEVWARRAIEAGRLVAKPKGKATPDKTAAYEQAVARKARDLVTRIVLPGEWYLVRWGGTRKGSGTFYTRPGLAVPTVQRTLRPLAYDPRTREDGTPDVDAPAAEWTPKTPEDILALKVCDPACGSGTFPVSALRFLTDALYASLHHHDRIRKDGERSVVHLLGAPAGDDAVEEPLGAELLPARPDDPLFEPRLKARLRRHVVERSIYGVDLDPLAVELCRLALWIETMDRSLPFSFLDHKVKVGNALVGAWLDTFRHYPAMAWKNREGGDKGHTNGVHFEKEARTKAIKAFVRDRLLPDLRLFLAGQTLFLPDQQAAAEAAHAGALDVLTRLHELPVHETAERARVYREELLGSPDWQAVRDAMDLWCACWFWPADELGVAPLPTAFAAPDEATRAVAGQVAAAKRFFHWELEFPDVFRAEGAGFDAVLGNPPWDIAKPSSKEFFSNLDPLYRSYGKQEALAHQEGYFADAVVERAWLDYNADFRAQSNFMSAVAWPFGDPKAQGGDRVSIVRGNQNDVLHDRWRDARVKGHGRADRAHPFRHQGSADLNLYKLFLEQAHALLRPGGRLGFIVPSGLYSDHGTGGLRALFLDRCRWEWLFGFENRLGIFAIHRSFKFNPVIVQKGGETTAIRTAFMRRALEDWERAEELATPYARAQVDRFSPRSKAILEIQSTRDLEILEKIYANSVLLGDQGPDGWGITYAREFDMTNDSKLFPPRPVWEAQGYRPDEYSRWLKGDWRPIAELWAELGVNPSRPRPVEIALEDWLFDTTAGPERRIAEARVVHGHLLKPGDVARTEWRVRCAQPPYDTLPIPRADIPAGIVLSREGDAWIREEKFEDVALPLYQGRMIWQMDAARAHWSGLARNPWVEAEVPNHQVGGQFLMSRAAWIESGARLDQCRVGFRDVQNATNRRTFIVALLPPMPCGNKVPVLAVKHEDFGLLLVAASSSFATDRALRLKMSQGTVNWFYAAEVPVVPPAVFQRHELLRLAGTLALGNPLHCPFQAALLTGKTRRLRGALTATERVGRRSALDAVLLGLFSLSSDDARALLKDTDLPTSDYGTKTFLGSMDAKAFWRVDKEKDPELRHTVLTLVAFADLEDKIRAHGGDREKGIEAFLTQNDGEGWLLPETLRLADYGLGHDDRAKEHQPVASRLGPRFYDWQLTQTAEESWRECELHARNLLGEEGFRKLLEPPDDDAESGDAAAESRVSPNGKLF